MALLLLVAFCASTVPFGIDVCLVQCLFLSCQYVLGLRRFVGQIGIENDFLVRATRVGGGADVAAFNDLLDVIGEDLVRQFFANVAGYADPVAGLLRGEREGVFGVKVADAFPELKLELG